MPLQVPAKFSTILLGSQLGSQVEDVLLGKATQSPRDGSTPFLSLQVEGLSSEVKQRGPALQTPPAVPNHRALSQWMLGWLGVIGEVASRETLCSMSLALHHPRECAWVQHKEECENKVCVMCGWGRPTSPLSRVLKSPCARIPEALGKCRFCGANSGAGPRTCSWVSAGMSRRCPGHTGVTGPGAAVPSIATEFCTRGAFETPNARPFPTSEIRTFVGGPECMMGLIPTLWKCTKSTLRWSLSGSGSFKWAWIKTSSHLQRYQLCFEGTP